MNAKEYLNRVRCHRLHVRMLAERIEELETQAAGLKAVTYDSDKIQVSPSDKLGEYVVRIEALKEKYGAKILRYREEEDRVAEQIFNMPNTLQAEVLRLRYLEDEDDGRRMSFERIACIMHKSYSWVRRLHGQALREFERLYLNTEQKDT